MYTLYMCHSARSCDAPTCTTYIPTYTYLHGYLHTGIHMYVYASHTEPVQVVPNILAWRQFGAKSLGFGPYDTHCILFTCRVGTLAASCTQAVQLVLLVPLVQGWERITLRTLVQCVDRRAISLGVVCEKSLFHIRISVFAGASSIVDAMGTRSRPEVQRLVWGVYNVSQLPIRIRCEDDPTKRRHVEAVCLLLGHHIYFCMARL